MRNAPDRGEPGPVLVRGPVEIELADGRTVRSDRFQVALCTCRRSGIYPWCDTSHRRPAREENGTTDTGGRSPG